MKLALGSLALLAAGCTAPVGPEAASVERQDLAPMWLEVLEPEAGAEDDGWELVSEDPWSPRRAQCWPSAMDVADWRRDRELEPEAATELAGTYRTLGSIPGRYLRIHPDGRYEWLMPGCTGLSVEVGFARVFEDWVVLTSSECRHASREPISRRAFLLRDTAPRRTLVEPASLDALVASPKAEEDEEPPEPVEDTFYESPDDHGFIEDAVGGSQTSVASPQQ